MKLAGYCRVSTVDQAERGSIETQRVEIAQWAHTRSIEVTFFDDPAWSGSTELAQRPGASALMAALREGSFAGLVVWKLDRIARDPAIVLSLNRELERLGLTLYSVTEPFDMSSPAGEFGSTVLSAAARYERRLIIERSIAGQNRVASEGRWLGGIVPYGYRLALNRFLEISETPIPGLALSEAEVVRRAFRRCAEDGWGTQRIADEMNALHVPTAYARDERQTSMGAVMGTRAREGKRLRNTAGSWSAGAVLRLLHSEIYSGVHSFGRRSRRRRELVKRDMPAIVSPALFQRVGNQLKANLRFAARRSKREYALRSLLVCEHCGHVLVGCHYRTKTRDVLQYTCASHPTGSRPPRIWARSVEDALWADIVEFAEHPDETLAQAAKEVTSKRKTEKDIEIELLSIARAVAELRQKEERAVDLALSDLSLTHAVLEARLHDLHDRIAGLERQQASLRAERTRAAKGEDAQQDLRKSLTRLATKVRDASPAEREAAFRLLITSATVARVGNQHRLTVTYAFRSPGAVAAAKPIRAHPELASAIDNDLSTDTYP